MQRGRWGARRAEALTSPGRGGSPASPPGQPDEPRERRRRKPGKGSACKLRPHLHGHRQVLGRRLQLQHRVPLALRQRRLGVGSPVPEGELVPSVPVRRSRRLRHRRRPPAPRGQSRELWGDPEPQTHTRVRDTSGRFPARHPGAGRREVSWTGSRDPEALCVASRGGAETRERRGF